ncbi:MAG TPA: hypothetical protein VEA41_14825 [Salinarimonas sp.]|jgi:hypothetical protein|nr:hypothetical protein [Salinarimonas sp.]
MRLASIALAAALAAVPAAAAEPRWRLYTPDERATLAVATTDEETDDFGSPAFSCRMGSGRIDVSHRLRPKEREWMAAAVRRGVDPRLQTVPAEAEAIVPRLAFTRGEDWEAEFELPVGSPPFERLRREGVFEFRLGTLAVRIAERRGLDQVARFQEVCRSGKGRQP